MPTRVTKATIDHDRIQRWAEERGGKPVLVRGTGILRLDFPGFAGPDKLQRVSWDDWFDRFEEANLALVYEEKTAGGVKSNFNKLVGRETVDLRTAELIATPRRRAKQGARSVGEARRVRRAPARAARTARAKKARKAPRAARPVRRRGARAS